MENKVKWNLNQTFFIILCICIFLVVPSSYAEEIPILLEMNKENYEFGDPIILHVIVDKVIPNTPLQLHIFKDGSPIQYEPFEIIPKLEDGSGHYLITQLNGQSSGIYEIFVYYGAKTYKIQDDKKIVIDRLGSNSIEVKYNSESSSSAEFLDDNFMVDEFDIGTEMWISELKSYSFPKITFCEINFCYDSMIAKQFDEGGTGNFVRVEIFEFKDTSITKEFYSKLLEDPLQYDPKKRAEINIREGFECDTAYYVYSGYNEYAIICNTDTKLFKIFVTKGSTSFKFDFREQANIFADAVSGKITEQIVNSKEKSSPSNNVLDSISSNLDDNKQKNFKYNKESAFDFVDTNKDPQYYLDRYHNESEYREWFDRNYPDYTIEEAVGLEIKSKIPEWIKNIFEWYSQGQIDDDELIKSLQFLIKEGIIRI